MVLTERKIVNVVAQDPEPIDVPGLVTFSSGLFLLIFGLIRGNPEGWGSPLILACLIGAAVLLLAFFTIERRSNHPMLDLTLFRKAAFNGVSVDSTWTTLLAGFILAGIGIGTTNPGIGQAAIAVVPVEKSGMGSGINTTFRQVGIATGVAGLGAVFQGRVDAKLGELLPGAPDGVGEAVASGGSRAVAELQLPPEIHVKATHAADAAFVSAFNEIILIAAIGSFLGAALGFWLVRSKDFVQPTDGPSEPGG
jgi:hypothetical protein